jgi:outer membrane protein TolC
LFGGTTRNVNFGVSISFPFKNRTAEANLATARVQREQLEASFRSQDQAIEMDVRNAAQAVDTCSSPRDCFESRERKRRTATCRRRETLRSGPLDDVLIARTAELSDGSADRTSWLRKPDYNKALADLQRATGSTLRVNNVVVQTPTTK